MWLNYDWGVLPLLSKFPKLRGALVSWNMLPAQYDVAWPSIQLVDIRRKLPLANEVVQYIYCSHVLEHLERWQAVQVLKETHRILTHKGCIRVSVPDFEKICRTYLDQLGRRPQLECRPAQDACRLLWGHPKDIKPTNRLGLWSRRFIRGHEWAYDHDEMQQLFHEAGFRQIQSWTFRKGTLPDLDSLELEGHAPHSLYMEATK